MKMLSGKIKKVAYFVELATIFMITQLERVNYTFAYSKTNAKSVLLLISMFT